MINNEVSLQEKKLIINGLEKAKKMEDLKNKIKGLSKLKSQSSGNIAKDLDDEIAVLVFDKSQLEEELDSIRNNELFQEAMKKPPFNSLLSNN
jgi:hypothetical protein